MEQKGLPTQELERDTAGRPASARGAAGSRDKLRVLACSSTLEGGGSERQLWQFVTKLDRQRFEPEVYLLARRGVYLAQLPSDVPVHAFGDVHPRPRSFPPGRISRLQARHLRRVVGARNIDVLYDRTFHLTLLTGVACPSVPPRISVIVSPPSRDLPATEHRWVWLKRRLLARAYRTAAATVCVSQEVADDAATFYAVPRDRLIVMPNPIDVARVRLQAQSPLQLDSLRLDRSGTPELHAAVIGRFTAEKGQQLAIEVAARLTPALVAASAASTASTAFPVLHLHLVGNGPLEPELADMVRRLGVEHTVHFHGYMTNPYPLLRRCHLAFVPSQYEGFPNVALEALALGVPLMMTDYGATARQIVGQDSQRGQLIPPGDCEAAVAAVVDRWRNPARWVRRAVEGQAWVEREHSLERWLGQMSELLERVGRRFKNNGPT